MDILRTRELPFLTRRNYYYEFQHLLAWSVVASVVEGGHFAAVVVPKSFNGGEFPIAVALSTPVAALLFSLFWGMLCVGRPIIRLLTILASATTLVVGMAGAIPNTPAGLYWYLAQMAAAQILLAGVVTVRSAVWRANYPRSVRGEITSRLQAARFVVSTVTVLACAAVCDRDPQAYRFIYPAAAIVGVVGVLILPRIRIRGERAALARHAGPSPDGELRKGLVEPFSLTALIHPGHVFQQMVDVLRSDRRFAMYLVAQGLAGVGNFLTAVVAAAVITLHLPIGYRSGYWVCLVLLMALPKLLQVWSVGRWGRLFDRIGVVRFRVYNAMCWMTGLALGGAATLVAVSEGAIGPVFLPISVALFACRSIVWGVAMGGGAVAWNIGHLHFAKPEKAEIYMGIHVSLTGLRGLIFPTVGILLWRWIGWGVWLVALSLAISSFLMFRRMARYERKVGMPTAPGDVPEQGAAEGNRANP